jgi:hypothetical protein
MSTAPCGRTRLRYGQRLVARLLLLISVAAGMKAVDDGQHRQFWLWLMLGCGVLALVSSTEFGLTDNGYELTRAFGLWHRCYPHEALDAWATASIPSRYGRRSVVWLRFRDGAEMLVDSSYGHFFAQLLFQLTRRAHHLEVAPGAMSFTALMRAFLRIAA